MQKTSIIIIIIIIMIMIMIMIMIIIIITLFIQYKERERFQRLSLYEGIRPVVIDVESILRRRKTGAPGGKNLGVRLRSTETQPTYDLALLHPFFQRKLIIRPTFIQF